MTTEIITKSIKEFVHVSTPSLWCYTTYMSIAADPVTISVPRAVLDELADLSSEFLDRMHDLLERNTDGHLNPSEKLELERLVRIAEFGQIISNALLQPGRT